MGGEWLGSLTQQLMPLSPGTRLGHYDVTALLGEGGIGHVWQATDTQLNRQVALKILPDAFGADPDRLARFTREAQILASLNHANIAAIYGIEELESTRVLVLELVEGQTLADRIERGPIPLDEALPIAKQIAEALKAAREAGVSHRNLQPANVRVTADGTVKVLDFGLVKAFLATDPSMSMSPATSLTPAATQMGMVSGTAAYTAPERAEGKPVDKRAEVWAFGAVLFEMLTGRKPFVGGDVSGTPALVLQSEPEWDSLPADTPASVERLLRRCLAKDPQLRLRAAQSNREVRDARGEGVPQAETEADPRHDEGQGAVPKANDSAYRLAADQGTAAAQFDLGVRYRDGQGVPRDDAEAIRWFRLAADQGDGHAQRVLGFMSVHGRGVPQDDTEAVRWFRLAADQGDAGARYNLGVMYANGQGVPRDDTEAVRWYRLAADQEYADAQFNLGFMYDKGRGVPWDDAAAVRWFRLAAEQGNAGAQYNLGVMYANGEGVPQDDVEAHMWYDIAAVRSSSEDRDRWTRDRDAVAGRMTSDHVAEAQRRAREWEPTREPEPEQ